MTEHGNELFAQFRLLALAVEVASLVAEAHLGIELEGDQFREQLEHADDSGVFRVAGFGSMAHRVPKKLPSRQDDRHRDVALEAIMIPG